jgi:magnesium chelatase subunit D
MAKRALLLLAAEPELRGVLIASESGSAESTLARGFASLLPSRLDPVDDQPRSLRDSKLVELPVSVTEDRLLGGLDLEKTLATGQRELAMGLLARSDRGVLFADNINLLDGNAATHVAHALSSREVRIEREGLSAFQRSDFKFIGTYNPAEGEVSPLLRDSVGLIVESTSEYSADEKAEIIARAFRFDKDPPRFIKEFAIETAEIESMIERARALLPRVRVSKDQIRQIAMVAMRLGVEGNRADLFAVKSARANAALEGREAVEDEDIVVAIQLVLVPRATVIPSEKENPKLSDARQQQQDGDREGEDNEQNSVSSAIEDLIIPAIDGALHHDVLMTKSLTTRSSGRGKRLKPAKSARGRYVRSSIRRAGDVRVAIDATLRAAAPFQLKRRARVPGRAGVRIEPGDLRFKEFKHRSGVLFIFAVDASGSMAVNRMAQAKGALTRLLQQAYLHRDKVALISFRGTSSEVLLAPTRSIELAKRLVDALPAGGGTPISAGVMKAIELARLARIQGMPQAMLVLFTDGRANVSLRDALSPGDELEHLGRLLQSERITSVVIDTKSKFVSSAEAQSVAQMLGARYLRLPRVDAESVYDMVTRATAEMQTSLV